jgi:hypothetical protein
MRTRARDESGGGRGGVRRSMWNCMLVGIWSSLTGKGVGVLSHAKGGRFGNKNVNTME